MSLITINKRILTLSVLIFLTIEVFCQDQKQMALNKFIRGNLQEKTQAVQEASISESWEISNTAIDFCISSRNILGNDRELDSLAVAATLSLSPEYISTLSENEKENLMNKLENLFTSFGTSSTVRIAVISKVRSLNEFCDTKTFVSLLNSYLKEEEYYYLENAVIKVVLSTLKEIGDNNSFLICYSLLNNPKFSSFYDQLTQTCAELIPCSMNEVISIISQSSMNIVSSLFKLSQKSENLSKNNLCEIAENVISRSILYMDSFSSETLEQQDIQTLALDILAQNKWTRASSSAVNYFMNAKKQFQNGNMVDLHFCNVINNLSAIAPIDSVLPLSTYLEELNLQTERGEKVSTPVIMSVIKTLGLIGDKTAFDSLLAVTYLTYPDSVLSSAREALSLLRWQ